MRTCAESGAPLTAHMAAAAGGMSNSSMNSSGHSVMPSSGMGTLKLTVLRLAFVGGNDTENSAP